MAVRPARSSVKRLAPVVPRVYRKFGFILNLLADWLQPQIIWRAIGTPHKNNLNADLLLAGMAPRKKDCGMPDVQNENGAQKCIRFCHGALLPVKILCTPRVGLWAVPFINSDYRPIRYG
ncbi:hypothetical protein NIASO_02365 [Niabella soli DSM 19437]|uniref:Uncharacterized protein n=1 Tax=Niabella soli DSM 19437 TaxID=929713 RepID=W0F5N6_9BACT|nr:hypothetical protein NIASO_02365 [Niabella soli DSM 19437]